MAAIVVRAVKDYKKILRKTKLTDKDKAKKLELEQFFKKQMTVHLATTLPPAEMVRKDIYTARKQKRK